MTRVSFAAFGAADVSAADSGLVGEIFLRGTSVVTEAAHRCQDAAHGSISAGSPRCGGAESVKQRAGELAG